MKQTKNSRKAGFTLVEIMIVVAIIGLLAAIAIPNFVKARATSQANGVNNLADVVGRSQIADGTQRAFLWQPGVGMTELGTLGGSTSVANAITSNGRVVGSAQDSNGNQHPFLWTQAAGMQNLGDLAGGGEPDSRANAANGDGSVIVGRGESESGYQALLWWPGRLPARVQDLLDEGAEDRMVFVLNVAEGADLRRLVVFHLCSDLRWVRTIIREKLAESKLFSCAAWGI